MKQPLTACARCQQAPCKCVKEVLPTANTFARSQHDKLLQTSRWRKLSQAVRVYNPQCQHIVDGKRCERAGEEVHHLSAALELFFRVANLVALCKECHWKFQGEPEDTPREYAPTKYILGALFEHPKPVKLQLAKGEVRILPGGIAAIG